MLNGIDCQKSKKEDVEVLIPVIKVKAQFRLKGWKSFFELLSDFFFFFFFFFFFIEILHKARTQK